jgi:hypothetical protein
MEVPQKFNKESLSCEWLRHWTQRVQEFQEFLHIGRKLLLRRRLWGSGFATGLFPMRSDGKAGVIHGKPIPRSLPSYAVSEKFQVDIGIPTVMAKPTSQRFQREQRSKTRLRITNDPKSLARSDPINPDCHGSVLS